MLKEHPIIRDSIYRVKPIRNTFLNKFTLLVPWIMAVFVPIILLPGDPLHVGWVELFVSGFCASLLALIAFRMLMNRIQKTFETLWIRGVVTGSHGKLNPDEKEDKTESGVQDSVLGQSYQQHMVKVEDSLNGKGQWWIAVGFTIIVWSWYHHLYGFSFVNEPILIFGLVAELLIGFSIGLMAWRMIVVGWEIWILPKRYNLVVQLNHPDRCGGLSPIGNLCLWNVLIIAIAGTYLGGWILIGVYDFFQLLLLVPLSLSPIAFFVPLFSTHQYMVEEKAKFLRQLDELTKRMDSDDHELLDAADWIDPGEGEKRLKKIELMQKIYDQHRNIPTWPINLSIFSKYLVSQAVPVISLVGVGGEIVNFVKTTIETIQLVGQ